jgi:hypothetical protein
MGDVEFTERGAFSTTREEAVMNEDHAGAISSVASGQVQGGSDRVQDCAGQSKQPTQLIHIQREPLQSRIRRHALLVGDAVIPAGRQQRNFVDFRWQCWGS